MVLRRIRHQPQQAPQKAPAKETTQCRHQMLLQLTSTTAPVLSTPKSVSAIPSGAADFSSPGEQAKYGQTVRAVVVGTLWP
jgi:hypothetical protein